MDSNVDGNAPRLIDYIPPTLPPTPYYSGSTSRTVSVSKDLDKALSEHPFFVSVEVKSVASTSSLPSPELKRCDTRPPRGITLNPDVLVPLPRPPKDAPQPPRIRAAKQIRVRLWYNMYRKLFTIVIIINLILIILRYTGNFQYGKRYPGAMILGNLMAAILIRNELFGRLLYLIVNTLFAKWPPLWFRIGCTSVLQHLGGIHSGGALSGCTWLIINLVDIFIDHRRQHPSTLAFGVLTSVCISGSIVAATPWIRNHHHNIFEKCHRFIGWLGLVSTWVFVVLGELWDMNSRRWAPSAMSVFGSQSFWFAFCMTVFVILPWCFVRKVPVTVEIPSPKVAVMRFDRGMQQGLLGRISRTAVKEYHAFGTISAGKDAKYHYMICGVQGDFTKGLVTDTPTHVWTRELKFAGVSNTSTLYKRGIRICTGTGLGAALSTCIQSPNWYLIWIGSDMAKTFGPTITSLIYDNVEPDRVLLWDSKARGGRPDTMKILKEVYMKWEAEVVFITSNYEGNKEMMEGCKEAGIPVFGTLWDF